MNHIRLPQGASLAVTQSIVEALCKRGEKVVKDDIESEITRAAVADQNDLLLILQLCRAEKFEPTNMSDEPPTLSNLYLFNRDGPTPLIQVACGNGYSKIVDVYIRRGEDLTKLENGMTPLLQAVASNEIAIVSRYIQSTLIYS